jgi:hypothetical protein
VLNNRPLFSDPTGHEEAISDFFLGLGLQLAYNAAWFLGPSPLHKQLRVAPIEPEAKMAGSLVGNAIAGVQGLAQMTTGGGAILGGGGLCLTGVGCLAGAPAAAVGAAAEGVGVAGTAIGQSLVLAKGTKDYMTPHALQRTAEGRPTASALQDTRESMGKLFFDTRDGTFGAWNNGRAHFWRIMEDDSLKLDSSVDKLKRSTLLDGLHSQRYRYATEDKLTRFGELFNQTFGE